REAFATERALRPSHADRQVVDLVAQPPKRHAGHTKRTRAITCHAFGGSRGGICAVVLELADLVDHKAIENLAVEHHAAIAARREGAGRDRPAREVEIGGACVLLETKWQLELAELELRLRNRADVQVHVAPRLEVVDLVLDLKIGIVSN